MVWVVPLNALRNLVQDLWFKNKTKTHLSSICRLPFKKHKQKQIYVKSIVIVIVIFSYYYLIISSFC